MRLPVLLALLLLATAGLSGCTVYNDFQRFLARIQGTEMVEVEVLNEEVPFARTDPPTPGPPPALGKRTALTFQVPDGARSLLVDVTVTFDAAPPLGALPGQVNVTVAPPGGAGRTFTFTQTGAQEYASEPPAAGTWTVDVATRGEGRVRVVATTVQPAA